MKHKLSITFRLAPRLHLLGCAAGAAATLLCGIAAARASDATTLADHAGFLLGHALRCGVSDVRLQPSAALIGKLIDAYSLDRDDRAAAQTELVERIVASASPAPSGDPLPACPAVLGQLSSFEQHRLAPVARNTEGQSGKPAAPAAAPTAARREAPDPRGRAAPALQRAAAAKMRGGGRRFPPSI